VLRRHFQLDHDEADDIVQRAWLLLLERQPARHNVFGWLYTTAKREAFARWQHRRREAPVEQLEEPLDEPDLPARLDRAELRRRLAATFTGWLTRNQRAAMWLWAQGYEVVP
jgi:DNA-directed RNA polymerase specialized sigma24 family protein